MNFEIYRACNYMRMRVLMNRINKLIYVQELNLTLLQRSDAPN